MRRNAHRSTREGERERVSLDVNIGNKSLTSSSTLLLNQTRSVGSRARAIEKELRPQEYLPLQRARERPVIRGRLD